MIDEKIILLITNELTGQLTKDEKGILEDWLQESKANRNFYHDYRDVFLNGTYQVKHLNSEEVYAKLSEKLNFSDRFEASNSSINRGLNTNHSWYKENWLKVAASLLILAMVAVTVFQTYFNISTPDTEQPGELIVKSNPIGMKTFITLPDGSRVKLNAESYLEYSNNFEEERTVKLIGEAFFEVVEDTLRPFVVKTGNLNIKVLGTSFNVEAFPFEKDVKVALVTGKVQIGQMDGLELKPITNLSPDEMLVYNHQTTNHRIMPFETESTIAWVDGTLVFVEEEMIEVIKELERWYGVEIQIAPDVDLSGRINGKYENAPLELVLKGIGFTSDFSFTIEGKKVYIK